jgi:hypothetical protein
MPTEFSIAARWDLPREPELVAEIEFSHWTL